MEILSLKFRSIGNVFRNICKGGHQEEIVGQIKVHTGVRNSDDTGMMNTSCVIQVVCSRHRVHLRAIQLAGTFMVTLNGKNYVVHDYISTYDDDDDDDG